MNYSENMFDFIPAFVISFEIPQEEFNPFTGVNILPDKGRGGKFTNIREKKKREII